MQRGGIADLGRVRLTPAHDPLVSVCFLPDDSEPSVPIVGHPAVSKFVGVRMFTDGADFGR